MTATETEIIKPLTATEIIVPSSYHILVRMLKAPRKIGIIEIPEERAAREDAATPMAEVLAMGPDCFMNLEVVPPSRKGTPRCKVGDTILVRPYTGSTKVRLKDDEEEYRIIVDDAVEAVITDYTMVRRGE